MMGHKKKIKILGSLALIILLAMLLFNSGTGSFWRFELNESNQSESRVTYDLERVGEGGIELGESFGISLSLTGMENNKSLSKFLNHGENLSGYLSVNNQMHDAYDYLVFCLLDYEQVPFTFNNESGQILHKIHLEPYEAGFYPFELAEIEGGGHDFEIMVIFRPYENSLNETFRRSTRGGHLGSQRRNLFVGNYSDLPAVNYTNMSVISCCSCGSEYMHGEGMLITKKPCSKQLWLTEEVEPGGLLNYTINAGTYEYPVTFAMMVLLDYKPIPLNVNGSDLVIFGEFEPEEFVAIPASLSVPEEKGVHELLVLWFPVPYKRLETSPGVRVLIEQWPWSVSSTRVGLNVT
jgi:hypothetical protein